MYFKPVHSLDATLRNLFLKKRSTCFPSFIRTLKQHVQVKTRRIQTFVYTIRSSPLCYVFREAYSQSGFYNNKYFVCVCKNAYVITAYYTLCQPICTRSFQCFTKTQSFPFLKEYSFNTIFVSKFTRFSTPTQMDPRM